MKDAKILLGGAAGLGLLWWLMPKSAQGPEVPEDPNPDIFARADELGMAQGLMDIAFTVASDTQTVVAADPNTWIPKNRGSSSMPAMVPSIENLIQMSPSELEEANLLYSSTLIELSFTPFLSASEGYAISEVETGGGRNIAHAGSEIGVYALGKAARADVSRYFPDSYKDFKAQLQYNPVINGFSSRIILMMMARTLGEDVTSNNIDCYNVGATAYKNGRRNASYERKIKRYIEDWNRLNGSSGSSNG